VIGNYDAEVVKETNLEGKKRRQVKMKRAD
jgi:hypothetical protein